MLFLITEQQKEFLFKNTLDQVVDKDSATLIFLKELFDVKAENNPLSEPIFFVCLFEFITYFLYVYSPSSLVQDPCKQEKRIKVINACINKSVLALTAKETLDNLLQNEDLPALELKWLEGSKIGLSYNINPLIRQLRINITIKESTFYNVLNITSKPKIFSFSFETVVKDPLEFLYKIISMYNELVDLMPYNEEIS
jgi:hypothetical protein